jgi:hypothetical protein
MFQKYGGGPIKWLLVGEKNKNFVGAPVQHKRV